jgi:selenide,water dikinase
MQSSSATDKPVVKDLVLVGGGHSHVAVLKMLGMKPVSGLRVTLVTRDVHTPYSGMLPGLISGRYDFDEAHIDLRPLCEFAGARLFHDSVVGIDLDERTLTCQRRPPVAFDLVSFDIGSAPDTESVPGAAEFTTPVKPIDAFLERLDRLVDDVEREHTKRVAVVGGGAGGVELALALERRLRSVLGERAASARERAALGVDIELFSATDALLPEQNQRASQKFARILAERRIAVHTGCPVERVEQGELIDADETHHACDEIIWVTQASAPAWVAQTGLATDDDGFILVDDCLRSTSHPFVFAAGDIASMKNHNLAKSGVYAVRQGMPLGENLRRAATGRSLAKYRPQKSFLSLIGTAEGRAVGVRGWLAFEGAWAWRLKEWIDRRWMKQWEELPQMEDADEPAPIEATADTAAGTTDSIAAHSSVAMRCGGCGSKLGHDVLSRVLDRLETVERDDVLVGLDAPDDSAVIQVPDGKVLVQSVDFFRSFIDDPYTFGRIAANHSLGDVWAMGASPQAALAIAVVPFGAEAKVEEDLYQLMAGALEILGDSGAALVGGHSGEGAEMAFGLQVNGLADPDQILRKGGMRPGDALILTKPIGTGTLFAANMRRRAKGRWIEAALDVMAQSSKDAATCLLEHGATACTDVTGFGVLGHLVEMTRPSNVDVVLDLDALPLLDGALECVEAGIFSSLQPDNVRLRRAIHNVEEVRGDARYPLIFDPQTAGGLLASVPGESAEACVAALRQCGYGEAVVIGRVEARGKAVEAIRVEF